MGQTQIEKHLKFQIKWKKQLPFKGKEFRVE